MKFLANENLPAEMLLFEIEKNNKKLEGYFTVIEKEGIRQRKL